MKNVSHCRVRGGGRRKITLNLKPSLQVPSPSVRLDNLPEGLTELTAAVIFKVRIY